MTFNNKTWKNRPDTSTPLDAEGLNDLEVRIGDKIDDITTQLAQTIPYLNNGRLVLPSDFPKLPFNIFKNKYEDWYSDATPYNQFDWSDATHVHISAGTTNINGLNHMYPITLRKFRDAFNGGEYGSQTKFVLNLIDYVYWGDGNNQLTLDIDADILIRASNVSNFTWIGRVKNSSINTFTSPWIVSNSVFKTTQTDNHDVRDVVNLNVFDDFKMPSVYNKVTSLSDCQSQKGSFFRDEYDVYCNPLDEHDINDVVLLASTAAIILNQANARTVMFENIGFLSSAYGTGKVDNLKARFYAFGCKFYRSSDNAFYINGKYNAYLFDCVASYGTLDAFNYHTDSESSVATEVNCVGYGSGKHKMASGQPSHSNNGSTAHDGMNMLRVGSRYYDCEGPIVADVDNCYSISIGCEASSILDSSTGAKVAYSLSDGDATSPKPKYVIECKGFGKNVEIGVRGTEKTYVSNFTGVQNFEGNVKVGENIW